MDKVKIGWIGLGTMGTPMAQQLIKAGYPVTVYNRSKNREEALRTMGATIASSPAAIMQQSDIVILMVTDDQATREIFTSEQGLLSAKATGKIIISMSTISPAISNGMAALCKRQGNNYLDAPVSGSVKQAEDKQLVIMVGGEQAVFEQAKPVLEQIGRLALRVGDTGAGNAAKLAINVLLGIQAQGLAEAVVFAGQNGIKSEDFFTLVNNGAMGNVFIKIKAEAILQNDYRPAFALKHIAKDLRLAKAAGLKTPVGEVVFQTFQQAEPALGEQDIIAIIKEINVTGKASRVN